MKVNIYIFLFYMAELLLEWEIFQTTGRWKHQNTLYINYQLDAQIIIYLCNIKFLYMFRAINAHLQEVTLYTCSIWYRHSLRAVVVACRYTDWVRTEGELTSSGPHTP